VTVSFDRTEIPERQFKFVPDPVTMWYAGKIILKKSSPDAPWRFQGGTVQDDTLREFRVTVEGDNVLHIFNEMRDPPGETRYTYNVTVRLGNESFTCKSPVIVNDPH